MGKDALVQARWVGPFDAEIPGVPDTVHVGDTVEVPEANLGSAHFEAVQKTSKKAAD